MIVTPPSKLTFIPESDLPSEMGGRFGYGPQSDKESQPEESPAQETTPPVEKQLNEIEEAEGEQPNIFVKIINFIERLIQRFK